MIPAAVLAVLALVLTGLAVWILTPAMNTYIQVRHDPCFRYSAYDFSRPDTGYPVDRPDSREMVLAGYYARPPLDGDGVPVTDYRWMRAATMPKGRFHNVSGIAQYALWACFFPYIRSGEETLRREFMHQAEWLVRHQAPRGAYPNAFGMPSRGLEPGWVSAMYQGLAASVLVRAYVLSAEDRFLEAAVKAVTLMLAPMSDGGTVAKVGEDLWLEEYPADPPGHVLNGLVFAWWGLFDVCTVRPDDALVAARDAVADTLARHIESYETPRGALYELGAPLTAEESGYLGLQAAQLHAMAAMTGDERFSGMAATWEARESPKRRPSVPGALARAIVSGLVYRVGAFLKSN